MESPHHVVGERLQAVQTAPGVPVVGSARCEVCGVPLSGRQRVACSDACRAARWRQRGAVAQHAAQQARDRDVRALLRTAQESIDAALRRLTTEER